LVLQNKRSKISSDLSSSQVFLVFIIVVSFQPEKSSSSSSSTPTFVLYATKSSLSGTGRPTESRQIFWNPTEFSSVKLTAPKKATCAVGSASQNSRQ
jgi:hypothetical protein